MPFIDQIIDECVGNEIFSFMDRFSSYNQITIRPKYQHKTTFICPCHMILMISRTLLKVI